MKRITFIVNPISGLNKDKQIAPIIDSVLDKSQFIPTIVYTERKGHATELARQAVAAGEDIVVAVGGDGTLNEVAQELVNTPAVLGLIPMGSGNGLAHHIGVDTDVKQALKEINYGRVETIDACTIDDRFFISIAGVGYDAYVAKVFNQIGKRGFANYAKIATSTYFNYEPRKYKIICDGKVMEKEAFFITFANSSQWGYNTKISPKASLQDGLIDVCIMKKPPFVLIGGFLTMLFAGMIHKTYTLEIIQAHEVEVSEIGSKKPMLIHVDGDYCREKSTVCVKNHHNALKMIVGKDAK